MCWVEGRNPTYAGGMAEKGWCVGEKHANGTLRREGIFGGLEGSDCIRKHVIVLLAAFAYNGIRSEEVIAMQVFAANGSPDKQKGNTAMVLAPFLEGMEASGVTTELIYPSELEITPCTGEMHCWYKHPGACIHQDVMQALYPKIKGSDVLILAMPVYIPIPGRMQIFINRLCPLILPELVKHGDRTRARFHDDVEIKKIVLVSSGGWWEKGNFETVTMIAKELALNGGVEFAGALIRPHAILMRSGGVLTENGQVNID